MRLQPLHAIHFPADADDLDLARARLGFEEVFQLSLAALLNKYELLKDKALTIPFKEEVIEYVDESREHFSHKYFL